MSFIASKILWVFFSPGSFLVLLLLTGAFMSASHDIRFRILGRRVTFVVALIFFLVGIFPVGGWMLAPLENRFPPRQADNVTGIILLGGDEKPHFTEQRGQPVMLDSARRYIEFAALARKYPDAKLLFSGGSSSLAPEGGMKDAEVAQEALASLGISSDRMQFETASRNTHENAVNSFNLIQPKPDQAWLLVTSAFHMPRAIASFRAAGWNVIPEPAGYLSGGDYSTRLELNLGEHLLEMSWAAHEYYGLLDYWLMGYIRSPWPK